MKNETTSTALLYVMWYMPFYTKHRDNIKEYQFNIDNIKRARDAGQFPVLVLEGGEDIHPSIYNERITYSHCGKQPSERDRKEIKAFEQAVKLSVPIFGICRGHQMVAALRGGSLYQDICIELGAYEHETDHRVKVGSFLEKFYNRDVVEQNSLHHQAVKHVPVDAEVAAVHYKDKIIEALVYRKTNTFPPMFTTQWHPERDISLLRFVLEWMQEEVNS